MKHFEESIYALIVKAATQLPPDVTRAIAKARKETKIGSTSLMALDAITENNAMALKAVSPLCQDTGLLSFKIYVPVGANQIQMEKNIEQAIIRATADGKLRPNAVNPLTGINSGNNLGAGLPVVEFHQWEKENIQIYLMLKGGGSENKSIQYSLPTELPGLGVAGRDLDGIRKCILHSVYQAQGQGCSPGFLGVGIGGDRLGSYKVAKEQLYRFVDDVNPNETLAKIEDYVMEKAQAFGIGTLGFGGEKTLLGCKVGVMNRLPASYFVSVAYMCWAFRRFGMEIDGKTGEILQWTYEREDDVATLEALRGDVAPNIVKLKTPLTEADVRGLKVGDVVSIEGMMYTGRDAVHKYLFDKTDDVAPVDLAGQVIYHCGPVVVKDEAGHWVVKAAGPTTSIREEPYQGDVMKRYGVRAVIGKGGMGEKTLEVLKAFGGVYLNAIGGAAQYHAKSITAVTGVDLLEEFGAPEAIWHLNVDGFTAVVTMDAHGNSLHQDVWRQSFDALISMTDKVF